MTTTEPDPVSSSLGVKETAMRMVVGDGFVTYLEIIIVSPVHSKVYWEHV